MLVAFRRDSFPPAILNCTSENAPAVKKRVVLGRVGARRGSAPGVVRYERLQNLYSLSHTLLNRSHARARVSSRRAPMRLLHGRLSGAGVRIILTSTYLVFHRYESVYQYLVRASTGVS